MSTVEDMVPPVDFPVALPYDAVDVSQFLDLQDALDLARATYNSSLRLARNKRELWARADVGPTGGREAKFVEKVTTQETLAPLHTPFRVGHDAVFDKGPAFFVYGREDRIREMVAARGLRVSAGVEREELFQKGTFPQGVYATDVAPSRTDITDGVLSRFFYINEWALPSVPMTGEKECPGADVSYFVMFAPNAKWTSSGYLQYRRAEAAFTQVDYWVMKIDEPVGTIVGYDIIAYGPSRIPTTVDVMEVINFTQRDHALVMNTVTQSAEVTEKVTASDTRGTSSI